MMKKLLLSVLCATLFGGMAQELFAQRIAYAERTPVINFKKAHWLDGVVPAPTENTLIAFIYSRSNTCLEMCDRIRHRISNAEHPSQVILITREPAEMVDRRIRECIGEHIGLISDESGRIFREFGVKYVPFAVLVDGKRNAMWFGNPITSERDIFSRGAPADDKRHKKRKTRTRQ